ncbi:MAG: hypothetical protein HOE92_04420 [Euryarchaeota archaeon]|jgi:hypothetical protein|nr:hypothetical protein [Euryarchaeota archaeon]MBT3971446.1 hypothetical protein [Euryarchaeota archaeon]MBT4407679.1 hypothetical protein [Euryarchaeota archaeon]
MAGPSQVEFPGKSRQRMRLRGTKQASKKVQMKLRRDLDFLMENPIETLPELRWQGKLSWGRKNPISKSLKEINKVISRRHDLAWLNKRMMARKGDAIAKAYAGSFSASFDEDISIVGTFKHPIYGNTTFIRKGDGKQMLSAGVQNHRNIMLRLLPWEAHAKKGWWFFSWKDGFVCTGNTPSPPIEWLDDVTSGLDIEIPKQIDGTHVRLEFNNGETLAFSKESLEQERKRPLIQSLALTMLPPKISLIADAKFEWSPPGWPEGKDLPEKALESADEILTGWMELQIPENKLFLFLQRSIMARLEEGLVVNDNWYPVDKVEDMVDELSGSALERQAAIIAIQLLVNDDVGLTLSEGGESKEREDSLILCAAKTLHHLLSSVWEEYGCEILREMGIPDTSVDKIWQQQNDSRSPFGKFFRKLEKQIAETEMLAKFPWINSDIGGACGQIHELILLACKQGKGRANAMATKLHGDVEISAAGWAWLVSQSKEQGQEWHFEQAARDRGGDWARKVNRLWLEAEKLTKGEDDNSHYISAMEELAIACGRSKKLPPA